jgi:hypothetical protein
MAKLIVAFHDFTNAPTKSCFTFQLSFFRPVSDQLSKELFSITHSAHTFFVLLLTFQKARYNNCC